MASDSKRRKFFEALKVHTEVISREQNLFALQFQYIATLANCNKVSINSHQLITISG